MRWFDASPRRATPKGHDLHHPHSTTSGSPTYIRLPSALVAHSRSSRRCPAACAASPAPRTSPRCVPTYRPPPSTAAAPSKSSPSSPAETSGYPQRPEQSHDIGPGIDFFKRVKDVGNFNPVEITPATILSGETPISIDWDYNNAA